MAGHGELRKEARSGLLPRTVGQVLSVVLVLGAAAVGLLWGVSPLLDPPADVPSAALVPVVALFVALALVGELVSVRIWRGSESEDLTFLEAVLVAAVLTMPPMATLGAMLTGLLIASIVQRRDWSKTLFNLGSYATSTATMILLYYALDGGAPRFEMRSVLALIVATLAFSMINTLLLSLIFHVVAGSDAREYIADEWQLSSTMALGGVGIGTTAVYLAYNQAWPLLPFVALPALAMWYAYGAAASHVGARERSRWLIRLGGLLAQQGQDGQALDSSAEAIRQIVGAPELLIVLPASPEKSNPAGDVLLASLEYGQGPRPLMPVELPQDWETGVVTPLDLGSQTRGALLLGSADRYRRSRIAGRTRGWTLDEADAPVLGALVAAVGSAMRAGAAFSALTEEKQKLTAVVDNTSDGIAMIDDSGQVRLWSQTMAVMTGVNAGQLVGATQALPDIVSAVIHASRDGQAASDRTPVDVHLVRADGQEIDVTVSTVRVRESVTSGSADDAGWVSILTVRDETRERRVARMKTDFVATISHELRTPITPIKGYAHLLATRGDRMTTEKRAQALQVISERADHLARLVDDLLAASRGSDAARLDIKLGVEDLAAVMGQAVSGFPQMADRTTVTLPTEPVAVRCDRVRVVQCLSNLLGNIEKYTEPESPVEVWAAVVGPNVQIHVRDHGPGIPADDREKVFERFFRREDPFTMRTGGAGLGLHIARELALAMGGGLTLSSPAEGSGAEFVLHLPLADDDGSARARHPPPPRKCRDTGPTRDSRLRRGPSEWGTLMPH